MQTLLHPLDDLSGLVCINSFKSTSEQPTFVLNVPTLLHPLDDLSGLGCINPFKFLDFCGPGG